MPRDDVKAIKAIGDFISASRKKSHSLIIKEFLTSIIKRKLICESGSILIDMPDEQILRLFNDDNFLVNEGFLKAGMPWSKEFGYYDGIAGLAFRTREIQCVNCVENHPDYIKRDGDVPIAHMVCVPVVIGDVNVPFGVACFHNADDKRLFTNDDVMLIKAYTETLGMMLELSKTNLINEKSRNVFIVHGHDTLSLKVIQNILKSVNVIPVVMQDQPKTGQELLEMLEKLIKGCRGGIVIMTPDDLGRNKSDDSSQFMLRARQNVIYEAGILTALFRESNRVFFLVKMPLEMPSDMNGLLYEKFDDEINEERVKNILKLWDLIS